MFALIKNKILPYLNSYSHIKETRFIKNKYTLGELVKAIASIKSKLIYNESAILNNNSHSFHIITCF